MKALAASNIGQYENSVRALADHYRTVELGLGACFREYRPVGRAAGSTPPTHGGRISAIVFGSDQGLVGQFNVSIADHAIKCLADLSDKTQVWAVGERVHALLADAGVPLAGLFTFRTPYRRSRRSSDKFKLKVKHLRKVATMHLYGYSIINPYLVRSTNRRASGFCRLMCNGNEI